jgi:putative transposase
MTYNPKIHHRRSIRLQGYDYSQAGAYFITICCDKKVCRFGEIVGAEFTPAQNAGAQMSLNEYGEIAYNEWGKLAERFPNFELDVFQIMPNHIHGIIVLNDSVALQQNHSGQPQGIAPTVSDIVGAYKSLVANECLKTWKSKWGDVDTVPMMGKLWQRNYYEHIIRDEQSYQRISEYIVNNPAKWLDDKFYKG